MAVILEQIVAVIQLILSFLVFTLKILHIVAFSMYRSIIPPAEKSVKDDVVLITGAGHGIGRQLALEYAAEGSTIVCWDINEENNLETVRKIAELGYRKAYAYCCDVTKRNEVLSTAKEVQEEIGMVTILINNAGIMPCHQFLDHSATEIEKMMNLNVLAHFWTLQAFLPDMMKINRGHIVALSSCVGLAGQKYLVPYCASKFGVRGLMEALHVELQDRPFNKIKTTTVYPYMTNTGLCKNVKIRFDKFMPILDIEYVAKSIVKAQKRDIFEMSIPNYLMTLSNVARILPVEGGLLIHKFLSCYIEPDP